jgi:alpha-amylase
MIFQQETKLRENYIGFEGGDIKGIAKKNLTESCFDKLGINAIWFTPIVEQIHGAVDEGTAVILFGYWARDWTATWNKTDLANLVKTYSRNKNRP